MFCTLTVSGQFNKVHVQCIIYNTIYTEKVNSLKNGMSSKKNRMTTIHLIEKTFFHLVTLTFELDLHILPFDLHAKIQFRMSVRHP